MSLKGDTKKRWILLLEIRFSARNSGLLTPGFLAGPFVLGWLSLPFQGVDLERPASRFSRLVDASTQHPILRIEP